MILRERFEGIRKTIQSVYESTDAPFKLIVVACAYPAPLRSYLASASKEYGFQVISTNHVLAPTEARNLARPFVDSDCILFIDNDVTVEKNFLETLAECADETGATVVGPLYLIIKNNKRIVHHAGGHVELKTHKNQRILHQKHFFANRTLADVQKNLSRKTVGQVEFHCMLIRRAFLEKHGALDDRLSMMEHLDLCLSVN